MMVSFWLKNVKTQETLIQKNKQQTTNKQFNFPFNFPNDLQSRFFLPPSRATSPKGESRQTEIGNHAFWQNV